MIKCRLVTIQFNLLFVLLFICVGGVDATILAQDYFDYAEGSELAGLIGGSNWSGAWTTAVSSAENIIQNSALQIGNGSEHSNDPNLISRNFSYYSGETLFFRVTLTAKQNFSPGDFLIFWLDSNNTSTSHGGINTGFDLSGNVMARFNTSAGSIITNGVVVQGDKYTLVVRLKKSIAGSANNYDSMSFWVNPSIDDVNYPDGTLAVDTGKRGFSWVGIRTVNNESEDVFSVADITLATDWQDVGEKASILAQDNFDYTDGAQLSGLNGGTQWESAWATAVSPVENTIQNSALQIGNGSEHSNDPNLISRKFSYYSGQTIFLRVTLAAKQNFYAGDFFILWLDTSNTSTSHGGINTGFDLGGNVMARINTSAGNIITNGVVVQGGEYTLVIRLTKSVAGSANNYDSMSFWVNPALDDFSSPDGTLTVDTGKRGFSWVGIRTVNNESEDIFLMDDLTVSTEWQDVGDAEPLPRWVETVVLEPENTSIPPLPTWDPVTNAANITFDLDTNRLANPVFSKEVILVPEALVRLPEALASDSEMASVWNGYNNFARDLLAEGCWWTFTSETEGQYIYELTYRLPWLALMYAASGQEDLGDLVNLLVLDTVRRPTPFWIHSELRTYNEVNPLGYIETAELTRAVSLASLWAGDLFSTNELAEINQALFQKGLDPCLRYLTGEYSENNFLAVIAGGSLAAAKVLGDEAGAMLAVNEMERWLELVEADGSYGEPEGYFEFALSRFLMGWWALGREEGCSRLQDKSLEQSLAYMVSHFILHPESSSSVPWKVNFGEDDYTATSSRLTYESLAVAYDQGVGTWMSENLVDSGQWLNFYEFAFRLGSDTNDLPTSLSPADAGIATNQLFDSGVAVLRSGWTFDEDILFALRGGSAARTGYSHDAPNRNAFALFVDGDYLLVAPGRASYRNPLHEEWDLKTLTYNTVTFNEEDQIDERVAEFTEFSDDGSVVYLASEAAESYSNQPNSVLRSVWFFKAAGWFVIEDTVDANSASTIDWSLLLANYDDQSEIVSHSNNVWILERPTTELAFCVNADQPLALTSSPGYMHSDYSYDPGDPGEGELGSAQHMVWSTTNEVTSLNVWTLIIPRSQNLPGLDIDFSNHVTNVTWTVTSGNDTWEVEVLAP